MTGGSPRRSPSASSSSTAHAALGSSTSGSAPAADASDGLLDLAADERGEPLGARPYDVDRLVEHPEHGDLALGSGRESVEQRPLERGQAELVRAKRALERMAAELLDELGSADDDPRLRPAEELVAREADEIRSRPQALGGRRLVADRRERAGSEVVHERQARTLRDVGELLTAAAAR